MSDVFQAAYLPHRVSVDVLYKRPEKYLGEYVFRAQVHLLCLSLLTPVDTVPGYDIVTAASTGAPVDQTKRAAT